MTDNSSGKPNILNIIDKIDDAQLTEVAENLSARKKDVEKGLWELNPFVESSTYEMISDYAIILMESLSKEPLEKLSQGQKYEYLIAATYTVAFTIAQGEDVFKSLPILAMAGVNDEIGKKIVKHFSEKLREKR